MSRYFPGQAGIFLFPHRYCTKKIYIRFIQIRTAQQSIMRPQWPAIRTLIVVGITSDIFFTGLKGFCSIWCYMASICNANGNSSAFSLRARSIIVGIVI